MIAGSSLGRLTPIRLTQPAKGRMTRSMDEPVTSHRQARAGGKAVDNQPDEPAERYAHDQSDPSFQSTSLTAQLPKS
jgi:hypothetical protein